jgi:Uma2 family endonuclease
MTVLITNPEIAARLRAEREGSEASQHDEVWDGVYIISLLPNIEHQGLASELCFVLRLVVGTAGIVDNGVNVSDCDEGWEQNYREPDVAVVIEGSRAQDCGTHWCGGPDFVVEILSPNDLARKKLPFYAAIGVRELLIIDREPWAVELYRLQANELTLVGRSNLDAPELLTSAVLPLGFRLVPGAKRPQIEVTRTDGAERWLV